MRATVPIVEQIQAETTEWERARLKSLAQACLAEQRHLSTIAHFGPRVGCGLEAGPALLIEDRSEVTLAASPEDWQLEYRLALLAGGNDMLVISGQRCFAYESHLSRLLGFEGLDVLIAENPRPPQSYPMPRRCAEQGELLRHITEVACEAGRLAIVPGSATGHIWNLARTIAQATGVRIFVAAPPPLLSRQVNNKLWFAERVKDVFGEGALPRSHSAFGPAVLAARVRDLSRQQQRVVIKLPDSAGSAGNLVLASEPLRHARLPELRHRLMRLLKSFGPNWQFPLQIEVWDSPVLSSPSVHTWIPRPDEGAPIVEGVFEQIVEGESGEFVGATRAQLPAPWRERLGHQATSLAILFQELGYFGRCSFDAVIAGDDYDTGTLHWIECNGRWGGVSLPMTFANRLGAAVAESEIVIVQRTTLEVPARPFGEVLALLADILFTPGRSTQGIIPLTPAGFERGTGVHFMAVAPSLDDAKALAKQVLQRIARPG
jgi:hypothetical protein